MKDYRLSEIQEICLHNFDCAKCPFGNIFGNCAWSNACTPGDWEIEDIQDNESSND